MEELDTQPDVPMVPTPRELPQIPNLADELEPEEQKQPVVARAAPEPEAELTMEDVPAVELDLEPEPALPDPAPAPEPDPAPAPALAPAPVLTIAPAPVEVEALQPAAVTEPDEDEVITTPVARPVAIQAAAAATPRLVTPVPAPRTFVEPEPTVKVAVQPPSSLWNTALPVVTFLTGAALASLMFLLLAPWESPNAAELVTAPDPMTEPVTTPLEQTPTARPGTVVAVPVPVPVAGATAAKPAAPLPLSERAARAGDRIAKIILPCLTPQNRRYQKIGVYLTPNGTVRKAIVGDYPWATEKNTRCMERILRGQDLDLKGLRSHYADWHLFMGETPVRTQLSFPKPVK